MLLILILPALLQALVMFLDEFIFHRRRGLPRWERWGHPLDTLTVSLCYAWLVLTPPAQAHALGVYIGLCGFSCLFITKDEFVHSRLCEPLENWLHALLFVLHPIVFLAFGQIWQLGTQTWVLKVALLSTLGLLIFQLGYWNTPWQRALNRPRS